MYSYTHYWQGSKKAVPRTKHSVYYLSTEHKEELYNSKGETMNALDKDHFVEETDRKRNVREVTISPENGNNMSREELHTHTQSFLESLRNEKNGQTKTNGQSMDYCYAIHEKGCENIRTHEVAGHTHVHVMENGRWPDIEYKDPEHFKELAKQNYHEQGLTLMRDQELSKSFEKSLEKEVKDYEKSLEISEMGLGLGL